MCASLVVFWESCVVDRRTVIRAHVSVTSDGFRDNKQGDVAPAELEQHVSQTVGYYHAVRVCCHSELEAEAIAEHVLEGIDGFLGMRPARMWPGSG